MRPRQEIRADHLQAVPPRLVRSEHGAGVDRAGCRTERADPISTLNYSLATTALCAGRRRSSVIADRRTSTVGSESRRIDRLFDDRCLALVDLEIPLSL